MKKLTAASAKKFIQDLEKAMDEGTAQLLVNTQSKLSAASPVDTGRLASSWVIGKNNINPSVAAKRKPGTTRVSVEEYSGVITFDGNWHVSNSLPYAQQAAYNPGYVGRVGGNAAGDWFSRIENNLTRDAKRYYDQFLNKVK